MSNTTLLLTTNSTIERFSSKTKISTTHSWNGTPCLEWTAGRSKQGYGHFDLAAKTQQAHRVVMMLTGIKIGELKVLHRCDNPPCVNTEHLFIGTQAENVADMIAKGRNNPARGERHGSRTKPECLARGDRNGSRTKPESRPRGDRNSSRSKPECLARGDRNGSRTKPESRPRGEVHVSAKLKNLDIYKIRQMRANKVKLQSIADLIGVSLSAIKRVLSGKAWAHVR